MTGSTSESLKTFTKSEAQEATDKARAVYSELGVQVDRLDSILTALHAGKAHTVLGYKSWTAYVGEVFPTITVGRAYQLLRHDKKLSAIEAATGVTSTLTENETRKLPQDKIKDLADKANTKIASGTAGPQAIKEACVEVKAEIAAASASDSEFESHEAEDAKQQQAAEHVSDPSQAMPVSHVVPVRLGASSRQRGESTIGDVWFAETERQIRKCPNAQALALYELNHRRLVTDLRARFPSGTSRPAVSA